MLTGVEKLRKMFMYIVEGVLKHHYVRGWKINVVTCYEEMNYLNRFYICTCTNAYSAPQRPKLLNCTE